MTGASDTDRAIEMTTSLEAGMVHVNSTTVQCEPTSPFGGVTASGLGKDGLPYALDFLTERTWITMQRGRAEFSV